MVNEPPQDAPYPKAEPLEKLSEPMSLKSPEHGYWGDHVQHADMETHTGDWQTEYGPSSAGQPVQMAEPVQTSAN